MDELLPKFLAFPPHPPPANPLSDEKYDEGIKAQIEAIKKTTDAKLLQQTSSGENALDVSRDILVYWNRADEESRSSIRDLTLFLIPIS